MDSNTILAIFSMLLAATIFLIDRPQLPLAVYLEIAAHLNQIIDIKVDLLPQTAPEFDYLQSQVGGLSIDCTAVKTGDHAQIVEILNYYERLHGAWTITPL